MRQRDILEDAKAAPTKQSLETHRESIVLLRTKGYSWREIAAFLRDRGVAADHTAVYRLIQGRSTMTASAEERGAYDHVEALIQSLGGQMTWIAGGASGGGAWNLTLHGRTARIRVRDNHVNDLDKLYVAKVDNPKTWDDYNHPGELRPDAFWLLVALFPAEG